MEPWKWRMKKRGFGRSELMQYYYIIADLTAGSKNTGWNSQRNSQVEQLVETAGQITYIQLFGTAGPQHHADGRKVSPILQLISAGKEPKIGHGTKKGGT